MKLVKESSSGQGLELGPAGTLSAPLNERLRAACPDAVKSIPRGSPHAIPSGVRPKLSLVKCGRCFGSPCALLSAIGG